MDAEVSGTFEAAEGEDELPEKVRGKRGLESVFLRHFTLRKIRGAKHPVPDRETTAKISVEVSGIGRVMHLMVRRAHENAAEYAAKWNP